MFILTGNINLSTTPWYDSNWFSMLIGSLITVLVFIISSYMENRRRIIEDRKNLLMLITQTYSELFSIIAYSTVSSNIDYLHLREQLQGTENILFILPQDIKQLFLELYKIHNSNSQYYTNNKSRIQGYLIRIEQKLKEYGVDIFEFK